MPRSHRWVDRLWLLPLLLGVASLASAWGQGWVPISDGAVGSVRAADLLRGHWSALGYPASISEFTQGAQRYHPGPAPFWALAPFIAAFGTQFGTAVGATAINVGAMIGAIRATARASRTRLTVLMALTTTLTGLTIWGPGHLYDPFNTMLPAVALLCGLVLAWRLSCGDGTMLPWAVVVATFCVQTHIVYATPLLFTLGPAAVIALGPQRFRPDGRPRPSGRRIGAAVGLALVLWAAPLFEALTHHGGNLRLLAGGTRGAATIGLKGAAAAFAQLGNVPPVQFQSISDRSFLHSTNLSALVVGAFAAWLAYRAVRSGDPALRRLVAMAGLALLAAATTTAQLPDEPLKNGQMIFFKAIVPFVWFALLGSWIERWALSERRIRVFRRIGLALVVIATLEACVPFQIRNGYDADSWLYDGTTELTHDLTTTLPHDGRYRIDARGGARYLLLEYGMIAALDDRGWPVSVTPDRESNYGAWRVSRPGPGRTTLVIQDPLVAPPAGGVRVASYRPDVDAKARTALEEDLARRARAHGTLRLTSNGRHLLGDTLLGRDGIGPAEVRAFQQDPSKLLDESPQTLAALYRNDWIIEPAIDSDLQADYRKLLGPTAVDVWAVEGR